MYTYFIYISFIVMRYMVTHFARGIVNVVAIWLHQFWVWMSKNDIDEQRWHWNLKLFFSLFFIFIFFFCCYCYFYHVNGCYWCGVCLLYIAKNKRRTNLINFFLFLFVYWELEHNNKIYKKKIVWLTCFFVF